MVAPIANAPVAQPGKLIALVDDSLPAATTTATPAAWSCPNSMAVFGLTALQAGSPAPKTDAVPMLRFTDEMFGLGPAFRTSTRERALSMDEKNAVQRETSGCPGRP